MTLNHLAGGLAKTRLVAVGERQNPVSGEQQHKAEQQDGALRICRDFVEPSGCG